MDELLLDGRVAPASWWSNTINAKMVRKWLNNANGDILVKINTYGGDVYEGIDIYNLLRGYANSKGKVITVAMSKCMSAGSLILFAGDERHAHKNSTIMCHKAGTVAYGNADEMQKQFGILDGIDDILAEEYKKAIPTLSIEEIKEKLSKEMWYIGKKQLLESGFVTKIIETETLDPISNPQNEYSSFWAEYQQKAIEMSASIDFGHIQNVLQECKDGFCTNIKQPKTNQKGETLMNKEELEKLQADYAKSQKTITALNKQIEDKDKEIKTLKEEHKTEITARTKIFTTVLATGQHFNLEPKDIEKNLDKATQELITNRVYTDSFVEHIVNSVVLDSVETNGIVHNGNTPPPKNDTKYGATVIANWKKKKQESKR